jgi:hypothetical protein
MLPWAGLLLLCIGVLLLLGPNPLSVDSLRTGKFPMWQNGEGEVAPLPPCSLALPTEWVQDKVVLSQCASKEEEKSPCRKTGQGKR